MQRRFSASTMILVVLLLGVLYGVGKVVNPPATKGDHDHDHEDAPAAQAPPPPAAPQGSSPVPGGKGPVPTKTAQREQEQEMMKRKMMESHAGQMKQQAAAAKPGKQGKAPNSALDAMEPSVWQERDMGAVTLKPDEKK